MQICIFVQIFAFFVHFCANLSKIYANLKCKNVTKSLQNGHFFLILCIFVQISVQKCKYLHTFINFYKKVIFYKKFYENFCKFAFLGVFIPKYPPKVIYLTKGRSMLMNIIVTGLPGSGKSSLVDLLVNKGFNKLIDITDRPRREKEMTFNADHVFVSPNTFDKLWESKELIGVHSFRVLGTDYRYGISRKLWYENMYDDDTKSVISIGPPIVLDLLKESLINKETTIILDLDTNTSDCANRMANRGDDLAEIKRRLHDDHLALIDIYSFLYCWDKPKSWKERLQPGIEAFSTIAYEKMAKDPMEEVLNYLKELYFDEEEYMKAKEINYTKRHEDNIS